MTSGVVADASHPRDGDPLYRNLRNEGGGWFLLPTPRGCQGRRNDDDMKKKGAQRERFARTQAETQIRSFAARLPHAE